MLRYYQFLDLIKQHVCFLYWLEKCQSKKCAPRIGLLPTDHQGAPQQLFQSPGHSSTSSREPWMCKYSAKGTFGAFWKWQKAYVTKVQTASTSQVMPVPSPCFSHGNHTGLSAWSTQLPTLFPPLHPHPFSCHILTFYQINARCQPRSKEVPSPSVCSKPVCCAHSM